MYSSSSVDKNTKIPPTDIWAHVFNWERFDLQRRQSWLFMSWSAATSPNRLEPRMYIVDVIMKVMDPSFVNHCVINLAVNHIGIHLSCAMGLQKAFKRTLFPLTSHKTYMFLCDWKTPKMQKYKNTFQKGLAPSDWKFSSVFVLLQRKSFNGHGQRCCYQPGMSSSWLGEPSRRSCLTVRRHFLTELRSDDRRRTNCLVSTAGSSWRLAITAN